MPRDELEGRRETWTLSSSLSTLPLAESSNIHNLIPEEEKEEKGCSEQKLRDLFPNINHTFRKEQMIVTVTCSSLKVYGNIQSSEKEERKGCKRWCRSRRYL